MLRNDWVSLVFRVALGAIFVYASLAKIADPHGFAKMIDNYHLLPESLINITALVLPWLELLTGMALILGTRIEGAATIIGAMLVVFIVAVGISIARGVDIDCGCFSTTGRGRKVGIGLVLQDLGMLVMAIYILINGAGRWALDKARARA